MSSYRDDFEPGTDSRTAHILLALQTRHAWPFPPPTGPTPWTAAQEREHAKQQREQLPEAPL
jgi:hypothetical protein